MNRNCSLVGAALLASLFGIAIPGAGIATPAGMNAASPQQAEPFGGQGSPGTQNTAAYPFKSGGRRYGGRAHVASPNGKPWTGVAQAKREKRRRRNIRMGGV